MATDIVTAFFINNSEKNAGVKALCIEINL